ncbi:MAG TPA: oxygenase MpaB family protein [Acidimicrobiales bacterium]|nr:oxygenase MpaB family protein [Acidimicrobiales bacterium]
MTQLSGSATASALGTADATWPIVRRIAAEPVTALLVQRALVMEVAHPKVAAAVADHSGFRSQPWRRALATADAAARIVFGDERTARGAVHRIQYVHDHIHGAVHPGGDSYSAHDPALLCWVWATLVDTAEVAFTRWVRPFRPGEADALHAQMRALGRFLGIPDEILPPTREAMATYLELMLEGPELGATPASRELARQVLHFRHVLVPSPLVRLERSLALATLDRRLLERLQLRASAIDAWSGWCTDGVLRGGYRRLPGLRSVPLPVFFRVRSALGAVATVGRQAGGQAGLHPYTAPV